MAEIVAKAREVMAEGNIPMVRGDFLRTAGITPNELALELGAYVRAVGTDLYRITAGD
jgi:hypothetical protein